MDPKSPGLWLLPTRGRVHDKLPRFFAHAKRTGMSTPGAVVVDDDDYAKNHEAYDALELPDNWTVHVVRGGCAADATREAFNDLCADAHWVGWMSDDHIPETQGWDTKVIEALTGWNCVSTDDGKNAPKKMIGAMCWSGDLVRAVGGLYAEGLKHFYLDDIWEELGRLTGCWQVRMDIMVRHAHASWSNSADVTTAHTNSFWETDARAFNRWKAEEAVKAADRVLALMEAYGVKMLKPDIADVRLFIATPCGDGRYESMYVHSLMDTMTLFRQFGAKANWAEHKYSSDIASARNVLFGAFLRSDFTHMLFVDSDQGWKPYDVVRMLMLRRDFVAVAGVRKTREKSFGVNVADDHGRPIPLKFEALTNVIEASEVGMAFTLITRSCAEKMAAAYEDMHFVSNEGRKEYGVFNPTIVNHRYFSEDFAFCYRWRQTGGKINVVSDISIDHVGAHVWSGCWLEQLAEKMIAQQREAA